MGGAGVHDWKLKRVTNDRIVTTIIRLRFRFLKQLII